jgi:NAD(P)H-hydrate repair Nnr-like enzyme with NAD(P)H-hydrate dehydratase domain
MNERRCNCGKFAREWCGEVIVCTGSGDMYRRREVSPGVYQCGCQWTRIPGFGDVLEQCPIHAVATAALVARTI